MPSPETSSIVKICLLLIIVGFAEGISANQPIIINQMLRFGKLPSTI